MLQENPNAPQGQHLGDRTTHDLRHEADEALRLYAAIQSGTTAPERETGLFKTGMALRIEVQGSESSMMLTPEREIVIGRADPTSGNNPELDLTPYAAYQMGISRRHAVIKRQGSHLQVVDLGSRNGTFLNGKKAEPHQPIKLHDGDEVRLGKMSLRVYFHDN